MKTYDDYFTRQIDLFGKEVQYSLRDKKILIVGCGGLGSSLGIALGSSGIGEIHLVDFDKVAYHNLHRQIAFHVDQEGISKAKLLKELLEKRSPYVKVTAHDMDFENLSDDIFQDIDLIIDATDNLPIRAKIDECSKKFDIPWIHGSVEEFHGRVAFIDKSNFSKLFKIKERSPGGIAAPIVMHIASLQANLALRYLTNLNVKKDYLYYLFFDDEGILQTQKFALG